MRVRYGVDRRDRRLCCLPSVSADVDSTVVLDRDVRTRVVLDLVDDLALGADDLTNLVDGNAQRHDAGRVGAHLVWDVDGLAHHLEQRVPGLAGLQQSLLQLSGRDTVELGIKLQGSHEVTGARNLEVHVAESILSSQDVCESDVAGLAVDVLAHEPHRDARDRRL